MAREVLITVRGEDGETKRVPVTQASDSSLRWWVENAKREFIADACRAEIERRQRGGKREEPRAEEPREFANAEEIKSLIGAIEDAAEATDRLRRLAELGHLISPAPIVAHIPEGFALSVSVVMIASINRETYPIKGSDDKERGLGKVVLDKIAGAAGVNWLPDGCRRLDDGSIPNMRHYQASGAVQNFDLSWRMFTDHKVVDLSDDGPSVRRIQARELTKEHDLGEKNEPYKGDYGALEILNAREHVDSNCATKARLRAIRGGLNLRPAYTPAELEKPFFVVRLVFTGQSNDPEAKREFRAATIRAVFGDQGRPGSAGMLFGPGVVQALPPPQPRTITAQVVPPPIDVPVPTEAVDDDDDFPLDLPSPKAASGSRY